MEGIVTLLGDIVAKFASFSEEHSFILAGFMIVTLFLIAGKMIESKNTSKEEASTEDNKTTETNIAIEKDNNAPITTGDNNDTATAGDGGVALNVSGDGSHYVKVEINPLPPTPPPPPLIHPKPIAELTLSDFLRGKRLRNPTKDFYFPRLHDGQIAGHLRKGNSLLVLGDSLVGKTRAVFESLKTLSDTELLIVKQEYSPKNLAYTPEKTLIFFDDIEEFLAAWGGELKIFITQLLDQGNPILATCRRGNEYDTLLGGLGSPFINENFERVEVAKMDAQETLTFQTEYPKLELDTQAYDHTIGSYFLELSTMQERFRRLGRLCEQYHRSSQRHVEGVLKTLNLLYYTHNTAGKNLYAKTKVFDFCQRKFTLSREDFADALMVLTADTTHLNFLEESSHTLYIEEVYLERIVNKGFNVANYFDDLFDLYTSAEVRERGFLTDVYAFSKALREVTFEEAKNIITKMRTLGISPNVVTYSSIIDKCANYDQAMEVLSEMKAHDLIPNVVTYSSIITKCKNYDQAMEVLSEMKAHDLIPNVVTYNSIIKRTKNYTDAMKVVTLMGEARLRPDAYTLSTVIHKIYANRLDLLRELLERFAGMEVRVDNFVIKQIQRKFGITIDKHCREVRP